jgi:hypothetical protein
MGRDPNIPTSAGSVRANQLHTQPISGQLRDLGGVVRLVDRWGNDWGAGQVRVLAGTFGNAEEGWRKMPRPFRYVAGSTEPVVTGDDLLIVFLEGDSTQPVVMGALWSLLDSADGQLQQLDLDGAAEASNKGVFRLNAVDANTGLPTGHVTVTILEDGNAVELGGGAVPGVNLLRIRLDAGGLSIQIGAGGELEPPILGQTFLTDLATVLPEIVAIGAGIPGGVPIPAPNTGAMLAKVTASLGAKLPYLSPIIKVQ